MSELQIRVLIEVGLILLQKCSNLPFKKSDELDEASMPTRTWGSAPWGLLPTGWMVSAVLEDPAIGTDWGAGGGAGAGVTVGAGVGVEASVGAVAGTDSSNR